MSSRENESRENNQNRNKEGLSTKNFSSWCSYWRSGWGRSRIVACSEAGKEIRSNLNNQVTNLFDKTTQLSDEVIEKSNGLAAITKEKTASLSKVVVQQSKARSIKQRASPLLLLINKEKMKQTIFL